MESLLSQTDDRDLIQALYRLHGAAEAFRLVRDPEVVNRAANALERELAGERAA